MELVAKCDRFSRLKHSTAFPLVFTEHGAIMARQCPELSACHRGERLRRPGIRQDARGAGDPQGTRTQNRDVPGTTPEQGQTRG